MTVDSKTPSPETAGDALSAARRKVDRAGLIGGLVLLAIMVAGYLLTRGWDHSAAVFPRGITLAGAVLSALLVLRSVIAPRPEKEATEGEMDDDLDYVFHTADLPTWVVTLAWFAGFFVALYVIGLFATAMVFSVLYLRSQDNRSWLFSGTYAAVLTGVLVLIFNLALTQPVPAGLIGPEQRQSGSFEGQTIELVVPFDPGGGYDQYARQLAPALAEELGAKTVKVVNEPGAGGLVALNGLVSATPDGTTIQLLNMTGTLGGALAEARGVEYEPEKFSYVGQITTEPDVAITARTGPIDTYAELVVAAKKGGLRSAATGPGSNEYIDPLVLDQVLGIDNEIVTGFGGSDEAALSLLQGNVDVYSRSLSSQLSTLESEDGTPVLVLGSERLEQYPDVPTILEVAQGEEAQKIAQHHVAILESGRTIAAPPDMDPERLEILREAFEEVATDPGFQEAGAQAGRPIVFKDGASVQTEVAKLMDAPAEYVDILKAAFHGL